MGLLDDYSKGVGSPRPKWTHQYAMARAIHRMYDEVELKDLQIASEITVTDDWDDLAPDLVIFDKQDNPVTIIEITTHKQFKQIINKCYDLIERFPDAEYFVYDYERLQLYMYNVEDNRWLSSDEYNLYSACLKDPVINYFI